MVSADSRNSIRYIARNRHCAGVSIFEASGRAPVVEDDPDHSQEIRKGFFLAIRALLVYLSY